MTSMNGSGFESKLNEIKGHKTAKSEFNRDRAAKVIIWGATDLVALFALALGAWSNQTVAKWLGFPDLAGWGFSIVIDGVWLVSIALIQLHREQPWKAVQAYQAVYYMVALSALTNFGHGLIRFGVSWHGAAAGLAFAVLPISLKWLISASTNNRMGTLLKAPNAKSRLKDAGMVRAELELNEALQPLMNLVNQSSSDEESQVRALQNPIENETPVQVRLDRVEEEDPFEIPSWVNTPRAAIEPPKPVVPAQPNLVPVESPKVPTQVQINSRQERVNDLAQRIGQNGGQLNSVTFAQISEWYGIDASKKSTLSVLRKDAHQRYLDKATQGPYM